MPQALDPSRLYTCCDPAAFDFETTAELPDLQPPVGQERAVEALHFGIGIEREGYNLFVMGPPGAGRKALATRLLKERAAERPTPADWCYVHNFDQPHRPRALEFPPGRGRQFRQDMQQAVDELTTALPALFESDEYRNRAEEIENEFSEREARLLQELGDEAEKRHIALLRTPGGFGLAPMHDGEVISPEAFEKLPEAEQERFRADMEEMGERLHKVIRQAPQWAREKRARFRELNQEFSEFAVGHLIDELEARYQDLPQVVDYLKAVRKDLLEHAEEFRKGEESPMPPFMGGGEHKPSFLRYRVNLLIAHDENGGAPVVYLDRPSYPNLIGRVEHMERMGALVTDFTLIKAGALHEANGGYLLLDARDLLMQPFAWEGLKRTLAAHTIRIDSLAQMLSLVSTVSLEPQPIPLNVKVVLYGERLLYYLLCEYDPDFRELFKVMADFEDEMPRDDASHALYARLIATLVKQDALLPFDRAACARVIEQAAREAEDAERLSTHLQGTLDLLREADHFAREGRLVAVGAPEVETAIAARRRRSERIHQRILDATLRETLRVDTAGARVGQINGLSVIELGGERFGHPTRITANVRIGEGDVLDIQREVELGGAIHSKGVLILSSFLATRYASNQPLSLTASLVFEQTYSEVDGDSASMAELCVLLSALADVPVRQSLAITGSVDQFGQMQAIGAVNEKIEGFFDLCNARGLDGSHGVLIPQANVKHLMLRADVRAACADGRFSIWPVLNVDAAIELLTGVPAGLPDEQGVIPPGSINHRVAGQLLEYSELRQSFAAAGGKTGGKDRKRKSRRSGGDGD
ncbi:MAG: AAA family ATPase [Chromatiales bacterium]|nr:AAA family ATPase [Chromatiales bacterium]